MIKEIQWELLIANLQKPNKFSDTWDINNQKKINIERMNLEPTY